MDRVPLADDLTADCPTREALLKARERDTIEHRQKRLAATSRGTPSD